MTASPGTAAAPASPRGDGPRTATPWAAWSLQTRLMLTVIGIVALTLITSAIGLGATIGTVMTGTLDTRIEVTARQLDLYETGYIPQPRVASEVIRNTPRIPYGFLLVVQSPTGEITGAYVDDEANLRQLSDGQLDEVAMSVSVETASTIDIAGIGSYRVRPISAGEITGYAGMPTAELNRPVTDMVTTIVLVTAGGLLLLGAALAVVIRRSLRPLRAVADTATRVAALPLAQGEVEIRERVPAAEADDRNEIGRVGAALNTLLDHVDASLDARQRNEERMRAFVADASHELRTPLASIRGYSELSLRAMRNGLPGTAENTEQALERIQAQSLRMTSLVEDLLLLARLDEGQELVYGAVDLTRLAVDTVSDARAAGPDHRWVLDVGDEPVVVAGDATRLTQVVANLLANARVHTPAGTEVTASVTAEGTTAVLRVHDDGPGIDPAVAGELFERFSRADRSRARQTGGTGLGLSIARAIVTAHGGTLGVASEPGSTTFELRLPARPADPATDAEAPLGSAATSDDDRDGDERRV